MKEFTDLQGLEAGQIWEHKNGNVYEIFDFVNLEAGRQDEYPTWVCYRNIYTGAKYGRAVSRWHGSFTRRQELETASMRKFNVVIKLIDADGVDRTWSGAAAARSAKSAIQWGKETVAREFPGSTVTWMNATGEQVSGLRVVD
jgi:hypothetical protein